MVYNQNSGYGQAKLGTLPFALGNILYVADDGDQDRDRWRDLLPNDSYGDVRYFESIETAYSEVTSNRGDTILLGNHGTHEADSMITAAKNRFNIVGVDYLLTGGRATGQRSKLQLSSTGNAAAVAATLYVTGVGVNVFGVKVMNSGTDAASVAAFIDKGEAGMVAGCSFMKFTDLDQTGVADVIASGDSTTWRGNEFGFDTLVQSVARPTLLIDGYGGGQFTHNRFEGNYYSCQSSSADKVFIKVADTAALRYESTFVDEVFNAAINGTNSAVTLTNAVASASGLVEGNLLFVRPSTTTTNFCAGVTDNIKVVAPAVSSNALEGVAPA